MNYTVGNFFDQIVFGESHYVRIIDDVTEKILLETDKFAELSTKGFIEKSIKGFSCDWGKKIFELWI